MNGRDKGDTAPTTLEKAPGLDRRAFLGGLAALSEYELRRLFELLPPELDPRTPVAVAIGRDALWPVVDESTFYRWIGNGS